MTPQHVGAESLVTADQMRARLAQLAASAPAQPPLIDDQVSGVRRHLRELVVLLDYFAVRDLITLAGGKESESPEVQSFIVADCELVTTRSDSGWRLRLVVRRETLGSLGKQGALATLDAPGAVPAGAQDVTHRAARLLLTGSCDLSTLSPSELAGVLRAREWLEGMNIDLPTEVDVKRALDLSNVLDPLRIVARSDFVGRDLELAMLEQFVRSPGKAPEPLAIHGPGGVGKSALVAKFVLDHVEGRTDRLTFAYLTFDRAELDPQFPLTLVREVVRQVALQASQIAGHAASLIRDIDGQLGLDLALRREGSSSRGVATRDIYRNIGDQNIYVAQLGSLVKQAARGGPLVMVLDTFEVAQRRRRSSLTILDSALRELRVIIPAVRIIVAGRAEAWELTTHQESLRGLTPVQARHLLRLAIGDLKVEENLIDEVAGRVSGNPLSLRLAAELMRREGEDALSSRRGRRRFLFGLRDEQVQGILYRRILDHIDEAVRPLASPGLVVRRITPEVISEVLAKPCGLGIVSPTRALVLFDSLRAEVSLVTEVSPGVLIHRADVRQEMLTLLQADDHDRVAEIHRRAVSYYGSRSGTDDRTEELYHRLMLGHSAATLDKYWDPVAGASLETAIPELPPSSRVYLASRLLDVEADPADLLAADQDAWVRQVTKQSRRLLDSGQAARALELLSTRQASGEAEVPAVGLLRIEALASLRRRAEALDVARLAMAGADAAGLLRDYVELGILAGKVAEDAGDLEVAREYFTEAHWGAQDLGARIALLSAGAGVLRARRRSGSPESTATTDTLRGELITEIATLTEREKARNPALLRELAAELGDDVPGLLADAAAHLGVETASKGADQLSDLARITIDEAARKHLNPASGQAIFDPDPADLDDLRPVSSAVTGRALADALNEAPEDLDLHNVVKEYWQAEADAPSFDYYEGDTNRRSQL